MDELQRTIFICAITFSRIDGRQLTYPEQKFVDRMMAKFPEESQALLSQVERELANTH